MVGSSVIKKKYERDRMEAYEMWSQYRWEHQLDGSPRSSNEYALELVKERNI